MKQKLTCDLVVGDTIQTSGGFDETIFKLEDMRHDGNGGPVAEGFRLAAFEGTVCGRALVLPPATLWNLV